MPESTLTRLQLLQAGTIATVASPLIGGLCRTLTWSVEGQENYDAVVVSGRQPILACWHGRILPGLYYFRHRGIVAIASQNFDGEWIARILARYGYGLARGSTSRGGARALVQMRQDLAAGRPVVFTLDGPRGPARVAQPGAVWLASATRQPILPFHIEADRFWTARSWDRTQIPKPFSTVAVVIGQPMEVSSSEVEESGRAGGENERIQQGRSDLERSLEALETRAHSVLRANRQIA